MSLASNWNPDRSRHRPRRGLHKILFRRPTRCRPLRQFRPLPRLVPAGANRGLGAALVRQPAPELQHSPEPGGSRQSRKSRTEGLQFTFLLPRARKPDGCAPQTQRNPFKRCSFYPAQRGQVSASEAATAASVPFGPSVLGELNLPSLWPTQTARAHLSVCNKPHSHSWRSQSTKLFARSTASGTVSSRAGSRVTTRKKPYISR